MEQLPLNAIRRMQETSRVEPDTSGSSTPLEAIQAMKKKEAEAQPTQPQREYINVDGFRVPKDFFTCLTLALIALNDKNVDNILNSFGFVMRDADGRPIYPRPVVEKPKKKRLKKKSRR